MEKLGTIPLMVAGGLSGAAYWGANDRTLGTLGLRVGYRLKAEVLNLVKDRGSMLHVTSLDQLCQEG